MDEPLSAIDALLRESLQDTLLELWQKRRHTQMLVTHSIEEAVYLGQRIIVFSPRPGFVVADIENPCMGTPDWRDSAGFSEKCLEVRRALAGGSNAPGNSLQNNPLDGGNPRGNNALDGGSQNSLLDGGNPRGSNAQNGGTQ